MTTGQRLLEIRRQLRLNQAEMGEKIGLGQGGYSSIETDRTDISKSVQLLLEKNLNINIDWLLTGSGEMFMPNKDTGFDRNGGNDYIPLLDVSAWAGGMLGEPEPQYLTRLLNYHVPGFEKADFLIPVSGDSMEPQYRSGDIIAIKKIDQSEFLQWGRVHVLDTRQGIVLKQIYRGSSSDCIKCVSSNLRYEPFEIKINDCHGIYLVLGLVRLD